MTQTNPEQWALDLLADIIDIGGLGGPCSEADCVECGKVALKIQAAFAEREARLVGALEPFAEMAKWMDDTEARRDAVYCGGSPGLRCEVTQHDYHKALAALKDRTHG